MSAEILQKLDEYALGFLDEESYQTLKQKKRKKPNVVHNNEGKISRRQKKKLKKQQKESKVETKVTCDDSVSAKAALTNVKHKSYRESIIELMGLDTLSERVANSEVQEQDKHESRGPEVVVFHDAAKKKKKPRLPPPPALSEGNEEVTSEELPNFNFKKARYEVLKFGISGFEKLKKEEASIALAIKLGAKPPKKVHMNYKKLMEMKKQEKEKDKDAREQNRKMGVKLKPISQRPKRRNQNAVAGFDAQVGKYRDGVQFVKKNDLK